MQCDRPLVLQWTRRTRYVTILHYFDRALFERAFLCCLLSQVVYISDGRNSRIKVHNTVCGEYQYSLDTISSAVPAPPANKKSSSSSATITTSSEKEKETFTLRSPQALALDPIKGELYAIEAVSESDTGLPAPAVIVVDVDGLFPFVVSGGSSLFVTAVSDPCGLFGLQASYTLFPAGSKLSGICVDPQTRHFFVAEQTAHLIYVMSCDDLKPLRTIQPPGLSFPAGLAVYPSATATNSAPASSATAAASDLMLAICDWNHCVKVVDVASGKLVKTVGDANGKARPEPGYFSMPLACAVAPSASQPQLFVSDSNHNRYHIFVCFLSFFVILTTAPSFA
jgi:hypothetical protein